MEALKIVFALGSPVLVDSEYPLHFDALVSYAMMRAAESAGEEDPWAIAGDLGECLGRTKGPDWVWQASSLQFSAPAGARQNHLMSNMIRRTEPAQFYADLDRGAWGPDQGGRLNPQTLKIDLKSGQQRIYQWLATSRAVTHATAWAIGDADALAYYLSHIEYLGKQGRNGYGRVVGIDIQPAAPEEADHWRLRWLPEGEPGKTGVEYAPVSACLRPPYWRRTARQRVMEPII